jgi:hypothetical protein
MAVIITIRLLLPSFCRITRPVQLLFIVDRLIIYLLFLRRFTALSIRPQHSLFISVLVVAFLRGWLLITLYSFDG